MPDVSLSRRGVLRALCGLPVGLALAGCVARPAPAPSAPADFDRTRARSLADQARAALAAQDTDTALSRIRDSLRAWPADRDHWILLGRIARARGHEEDQRLAVFFAGRIEDYEALHPLQSRLAFLGAALHPPADTPSIGPWARRLADYFAWKDARSGKQTGPLR